MEINPGDYYQRALPSSTGNKKCCSGRISQQASAIAGNGNTDRSLRLSSTAQLRGAELLCCCCSCSTANCANNKSPGIVASLGVCLLVFGYTLLGAFAFMALEGGYKFTSSSIASLANNAPGSDRGVSSTTNGGKNGKYEFSNGVIHGAVDGSGNNGSSSHRSTAIKSSSSLDATSARPGHHYPTHSPLPQPAAPQQPPQSSQPPQPSPNLSQSPHRDNVILEDPSARQLRAYTVERLWSITEDLNVLYKENWTRLAEREVLDFQEKMAQHSLDRARSGSIYGTTAVQRAASGSSAGVGLSHRPGSSSIEPQTRRRRWTFGSSLLYSITLITTIGYGSTSPRTVWGRLITIIYALAGIPLMLVYLSTIGDVLARTFRRLYGRTCGRVECSKAQDGNAHHQSSLSSSSSPPSTVPPIQGIIGKTSYHRYDNHIENKISAGHDQFYSSKSSPSDELCLRSTGSAILLNCTSGESTTPAPVASTGGALFQETNSSLASVKRQQHHHHHHFYPTCTSSTVALGGISGEPVCLVRIPISLCLLIILLYILCGAIMFNRLEGWSILEGGYFCFTSLGTIGFGDLVPSGGNASNHILEELSLCACSLYILAGMGLIAMCFNLMQDEVVRVVRVFGRTCGMSPIANPNGTRYVDAPPPPPPPPPSSSSMLPSAGIKSDLRVNTGDGDFVGHPCSGGNILNDTRLPSLLGQHNNYDRRDDDENDNEAIAMSLVSTS